MGGFRAAAEALLASPQAYLLTRERFSPLYFFGYTFIPLSSIAFPHITIFCLTARRMAQFRKTVVLYPLCIAAIWLPCVLLGVMANRATRRAGDPGQARGARRRSRARGRELAPEERAGAAREGGGRRRAGAAARPLRARCGSRACWAPGSWPR